MPATDPFKHYNPIDENNVLKINILRLKSDDRQPEFNSAIDALNEIRTVLKALSEIGRLQELGQVQFYLEALRWLHFEGPISNYVAVQQINSYEMIDANIASQFRQFVQVYQQNLRSNPAYSAIESASAILTQSLIRKADERAGSIVESTEQEIDRTVAESLSQLREELRNEQTAISDSISTWRTESEQFTEQQVQSATQRIQSAQSLAKWEASYENSIAEYKLRLYGPKWIPDAISRNLSSTFGLIGGSFAAARRRSWNRKTLLPNSWSFLRTVGKFVWLVMRNVFSVAIFAIRKANSLSGRRMLWFTVLAAFGIVFVIGSIIALLDVKSINGHDLAALHSSLESATDKQTYVKLLVFLPIAAILGLAYSFSIKNYRIYSNMLDQYEHRRTVAATAQGVILSLKEIDDADLRSQVTAAASAALFEHKNTGHLTKKESESLSPIELLGTLRGR